MTTPDDADQPEVPLSGGYVYAEAVVRVGDTVHRPVGPWTPAVHGLLRHLEARGFDGAPRVLGFDAKGREVLTYIEGAAAHPPWPAALREEGGIVAAAHLLRRYHDAARDFLPPVDAVWRAGAAARRPGDIVRHGDVGPWNLIWRDGRLAGLIDWDFAEPGPAVLDLAQLAWNALPLTVPETAAAAGFESPPELRRRLRLLCDAYGGVAPAQLLDAVSRAQQIDLSRYLAWGRQGLEPWARFLALGEPGRIEADIEWLRAERDGLV